MNKELDFNEFFKDIEPYNNRLLLIGAYIATYESFVYTLKREIYDIITPEEQFVNIKQASEIKDKSKRESFKNYKKTVKESNILKKSLEKNEQLFQWTVDEEIFTSNEKDKFIEITKYRGRLVHELSQELFFRDLESELYFDYFTTLMDMYGRFTDWCYRNYHGPLIGKDLSNVDGKIITGDIELLNTYFSKMIKSVIEK